MTLATPATGRSARRLFPHHVFRGLHALRPLAPVRLPRRPPGSRFFQEPPNQLPTNAEDRAITLEQRLDHLLTHSGSDTDDETCVIGVQLS